ncbi:unnamed protein product [Macrosiphum euphorbiae]|uniref:Uncharacterized protein n=1 Tax=Macrosiphum euphorbiae TaxID=13131 RepID=A0AAV0VKB9_9HEMI|nr:unnamed protein product [Macrosiphum euphorbiae]
MISLTIVDHFEEYFVFGVPARDRRLPRSPLVILNQHIIVLIGLHKTNNLRGVLIASSSILENINLTFTLLLLDSKSCKRVQR